MLAEGEYNPSQGTSSKNDEKDQNHYVPPEMEPAVFSTSGSIHNIQHAEVKLGAFYVEHLFLLLMFVTSGRASAGFLDDLLLLH